MSCQQHDSNSFNEILVQNVLAHWTPPGPSFTIELQIRLQVETLYIYKKKKNVSTQMFRCLWIEEDTPVCVCSRALWLAAGFV